MTKAVNQLAAGQKAASSLGTAAKSQVIVNAGGGGGPMIVPRISGRTVTTSLMRNAIAAQAKFMKRKGSEVFSSLSPIE